MSASALPAESELQGVTTLRELLDYLAVPDGLWGSFLEQVGDPGHQVRLIAALPKTVIVQGAVQAIVLRRERVSLRYRRLMWGWYGGQPVRWCTCGRVCLSRSSRTWARGNPTIGSQLGGALTINGGQAEGASGTAGLKGQGLEDVGPCGSVRRL